MQVLDGPPGFTARRLSSFLLIPVGTNRQGFAFLVASLPGLTRQSILFKKFLAKNDGCPDQVRA
jgi:hypothetical protein